MAEKPKTIFISCFFGLIARNILATDVLRMLKSRTDLRVVILCPEKKKTVLEERFGGDNVIIEGVPTTSLSPWESLAYTVFVDLLNTSTRRVQRLYKYKNTSDLFDYIQGNILAWLGSWAVTAKLARFLFKNLRLPVEFDRLLDKYQPNLIFSTDIVTINDVRLIRAARRRRIKVVGMIRSWDNPTLYGILPVIPDVVLVNNETIKKELVKFQFLLDKKIQVVGIPHYDKYVAESRTPREDFYRHLKLDPKKKTILFTPTAVKHWGDSELNVQLLKTLAKFDANVLARLPVMGDIDMLGFVPPPNVILDKPPRTKESVDADLSVEADQHLADSIYHSDMVITGPSTILIDGAVFNKPVIYVDFDYNLTPYWKSARRFRDYNHIRSILETGGISVAGNMEELSELTRQALADKKFNEESRRRLILQKRSFIDGSASRRIVDALAGFLNHHAE